MQFRRLLLLIGVVLLAGGTLAVVNRVSAAPNGAGDPTRGQYIFAAAGGCGCHGANLAGFNPSGPPSGEQFVGPYGTVYARNITEDAATGIGSWTDDQIANAIRNGVDDQGNQLFPVMPYLDFHFMSDGDVADLVAFLRTVPAVSNDVPADVLNGPVPAPPPLPPSPATAPTSGVDRGKYLVSAIAGCGDCHTPTTPQGAPDTTKLLAGQVLPLSPTESMHAPNITPDVSTGIGGWTVQQIETYLQKGIGPNGRIADTFMGEVVNGGFKGLGFNQLTNDDAAAIAAYLKSIPAVSNVPGLPSASPPAPPSTPTPAPSAASPRVSTDLAAGGSAAIFSFPYAGDNSEIKISLAWSPADVPNRGQVSLEIFGPDPTTGRTVKIDTAGMNPVLGTKNSLIKSSTAGTYFAIVHNWDSLGRKIHIDLTSSNLTTGGDGPALTQVQ